MSIERREIRPYPVNPELGSIFDECSLKLGADKCYADGNIQIDPATFLAYEPEVHFASMGSEHKTFAEAAMAAVEESGLAAEDVWLTITARSHYLKLADLLYEAQLPDVNIVDSLNLVSEVGLANRADAMCTRFHGCEISLNLVFRGEREPNLENDGQGAFTPSHGYWLARTTFTLRYPEHRHLYQVKPLTAEARETLRLRGIDLHSDTVRFLDVRRDEDLVATASDLHMPVLWLDEPIHRALGRLGDTPVGKLFQHETFCYFVSSVIHMCAQRFTDGTSNVSVPDEMASDSVLYRVLAYCHGPQATRADVEAVLAQTLANPSTVAAHAEGQADLHSTIMDALEVQ